MQKDRRSFKRVRQKIQNCRFEPGVLGLKKGQRITRFVSAVNHPRHHKYQRRCNNDERILDTSLYKPNCQEKSRQDQYPVGSTGAHDQNQQSDHPPQPIRVLIVVHSPLNAINDNQGPDQCSHEHTVAVRQHLTNRSWQERQCPDRVLSNRFVFAAPHQLVHSD